jgi:hypothetical protein
VELMLKQELMLKSEEVQMLKKDPRPLELVPKEQSQTLILFNNYQQFESYENVYVKNQLKSWTGARIIVTCTRQHHRDHS